MELEETLAAARDLRPMIHSQRDAIESERRLPHGVVDASGQVLAMDATLLGIH